MTAVKDIMKKCPVMLRPETTLAEAAQILARHLIDGAPVVTDERRIVGMISEDQLLDVVFDLAARDAPVSDYMTRELVVLAPMDPLSRAAQFFALYTFRRLPVVENELLVGIVSRRDLIDYALRSAESLADPLTAFVPELAPIT